MKINTKPTPPKTHGGCPAVNITPEQELRRAVLSCLLWEGQFYESGIDIADRIVRLVGRVDPRAAMALAIEARSKHNLRHVPLLMLVALAAHRAPGLRGTVAAVIQRPDELGELLSIYWRNGRTPIANALKKGMADAFRKFDGYQLSKYKNAGAIRLRDVMFLTHPKPGDLERVPGETARYTRSERKLYGADAYDLSPQESWWGKLADNTLEAADTWEVGLSTGGDKKETFERLLSEGRLGYLALLRNLRNMAAAGVDDTMIKSAIRSRRGAGRVLPFRYVAAARACPQYDLVLDEALCAAVHELPTLPGKTIVLVDVSASMFMPLSNHSDLERATAAATLASIINGDLRVFTFSAAIIEVPPRRGMAGVDVIIDSQLARGTDLAGAVRHANTLPHDRLIVITDEQGTTGRVPDPVCDKAYMINVASYQNGVGYGSWTHVDGFSENVLKWIMEYESAESL